MSKLSKKIVHDKLHMKYLVAVKTKSGNRIYSFDSDDDRQQYIKDLNRAGYQYMTANNSVKFYPSKSKKDKESDRRNREYLYEVSR